jgi:multidrug efflux pump subunit AcrB
MNTLFFRQPRVFALLVGMIAILGFSSYLTIGQQEDPTITNLFATIITPFPGADPERVEALVTKKLEDSLKKISQINKVNSTSRTGVSIVTVELSQFISDQELEQAWAEIRDAITDARALMPSGIGNSLFDNERVGAFTSISAIYTEDVNQRDVALRYARILQDKIRQVSGTDTVELFGEPSETIYVNLNQTKLASIGISIGQVANLINRADSKVKAGKIQNSKTDLVVELAGEIDSLNRLAAIPINSQIDGQQLTLDDIAKFTKSVEDPRKKMAFSNGKEAVLVAAKMKPNLQVRKWSLALQSNLNEFNLNLPDSIKHEQIFSQNSYTQERLSEVFSNMLIGVILVIAVLFFSLGKRSALIVAIVLPLTTLSSITVMQFMDIPIHQMSVTGLIVALGLLVDAAIVMTDDIGRRLRHGESKIEAVGHAVDRLKFPLLASTITTALAFMPMALLPGPAGDFVGSIAIAVIVMLINSLILALTITPALAGWMLTTKKETTFAQPYLTRLRQWFNRSMAWSLSFPKASITLACVVPVMGFLSFPTLTAQFFPGVDRNQLYIQLELTNGSSLEATVSAVKLADQLLLSEPDVTSRHWVVGGNAPAFYYNMIRNRDNDLRFAEALITTTSNAATERLIPLLQSKFDNQLPQAQVLVKGLTQGPPVSAPIEMKVIGPNLETLRQIGDQLRRSMTEVAYITHTRSSLNGGAPKVKITVDEAKAAFLGYSLIEIADILNASLTGITSSSLLDGTEQLSINVRLDGEYRNQYEAYSNLPLMVKSKTDLNNTIIPLSAISRFEVIPSSSPIMRLNSERINTIQGFIKRDVLPQEVLKALQEKLLQSPIDLPSGYRIELGGDSDARAETTGNLISSLGLIFTLAIATIVLTFNSYRLAIITFIVAGLSAGLSIFSLAIFNFPFGITALIGVIGSIGVSINAAIIILTSLKKDTVSMTGDKHAIQAVVVESSRHIVSTTVTTFGGFLPLLLAGGGFWPPFAMSIAGGVLLSTIVSFYFTPPMFKLFYAKHL